ncbi:MAG TPA: vWA domain-containing protein [Clostridia bacterium]|nr:vWA domain-containing protein [Clostridia bacterium]
MSDQKKHLKVVVGNGKAVRLVAREGPKVRVQGELARERGEKAVDLVFVIDTTGSMSDKIDGLLQTCVQFADEFANEGLDQRMAIVSFGDLYVPGDKIEATTFTPKVAVIQDCLERIPRNSGGGNEGESSLEAVTKALQLGFRPEAVKTIILITDEPAHQREIRAEEVTKRLLKQEVVTFVVSPPYRYFQEIAEKTGGSWFQVTATTDFRSILEVFRKLTKAVSIMARDVHEISGGSIERYLQLKGRK